MSDVILDVRDLQVEFDTPDGPRPFVRGISFTLRAGEVMGVVGESGSGKSLTAFSLMRLIDRPGRISGGSVLYRGQDLLALSESKMRALRGDRLAMIFQDPMMTLNPVLRIETQMVEAVRAHAKVSASAARARAAEALAMVGIPDPQERLAAYPHQFSGGMRQRVAIAIALLHRPDVLIADEPTTALDVTIQAQILAEVQKLAADQGTAVIWITHDLSIVAGLADQIAVMYAGKFVETGPVDQVLDAPMHPYTRGLLSCLPAVNTPGSPLYQIPGNVQPIASLDAGCAFRSRCSRADEGCAAPPPLVAGTPTRRAYCFHPYQEMAA